MELENIISKVTEATTSITDKIADWKTEFLDDEKQNIIQEFKENGKEKITQILIDLESSTEQLSKIGYSFNAFSIDLGIPPSISLSFDVKSITDEKATSKISDDIHPMLKIVLQALIRTNSFNQTITSKNFALIQVNIKLGILPDIALNYNRIH